MTHKLYDLAVKTGSYTKNSEEKGRYENIGSVMQSDKGQFLILKRTFNPAGVPNPDDKDSILVSCFEPKESQQQPATQQYNQAPPPPNQGHHAPRPNDNTPPGFQAPPGYYQGQ